jgi:hypothetical protein
VGEEADFMVVLTPIVDVGVNCETAGDGGIDV